MPEKKGFDFLKNRITSRNPRIQKPYREREREGEAIYIYIYVDLIYESESESSYLGKPPKNKVKGD